MERKMEISFPAAQVNYGRLPKWPIEEKIGGFRKWLTSAAICLVVDFEGSKG